VKIGKAVGWSPPPKGVEHVLLGFLLRARGIVSGARLVETVDQCESAAGEGEVVPAGLGEGAFGVAGVRARGRGEPVQVAAAATVVAPAALPLEERCQRLEERDGPRFGGGEEEQAGTEGVPLRPRGLTRVCRVARRLRLQAGVAHRAQVELDEGEQDAALLVVEVDEGVGGERPLAPVRPEPLPRLTLALELV